MREHREQSVLRHYLLAWLACVMLGSCHTETGSSSLADNGSTSTLTLAAPSFIIQVRAIDPANLILDVVVNGNPVDMQLQGDEWIGVILVPAGDVASIELIWSEALADGQEPLRLATYTDTIGPLFAPLNLPLAADDYVSAGIDDDQDGISNLEERRQGSNARDASDPGVDNNNTSIDVRIPGIAGLQTPPVIDGAYDSVWDSSIFVDTDGDELSIDNLMLGEPVTRADGDTEFQWTALHDDTYLYLLVVGEFADNDALLADSDAGFNDDSVEIYIDGNNSKQDSYDQVDDRSILIPLLKLLAPPEANNSFDADGRAAPGPGSLPVPADITFMSHLDTPERYLWEIRLDLQQVGIRADQPFGFEVQLNDDRDGGDRDVKWGWIHPSNTQEGAPIDDTWMNPGLMGTAVLE